uniref:DNA-directed RNA polymerase subunit beta'' n=1 Tax=Hydrodictyon reticulatum TaxID=3107 RepID=A0A1W5RMT9_HYDRE|nr:RNA polymerase beta subunit [Hydrodictyon reticulatum]AQU64497.1 RNA polymerase beta subunit [Hydrodictyon reticulatum]
MQKLIFLIKKNKLISNKTNKFNNIKKRNLLSTNILSCCSFSSIFNYSGSLDHSFNIENSPLLKQPQSKETQSSILPILHCAPLLTRSVCEPLHLSHSFAPLLRMQSAVKEQKEAKGSKSKLVVCSTKARGLFAPLRKSELVLETTRMQKRKKAKGASDLQIKNLQTKNFCIKSTNRSIDNFCIKSTNRSIDNFNLFWNCAFDKGRLKSFVLWFLNTYGEYKTIELLEQLKNLGFGYATKAGVSLGIDDLKIPSQKFDLINQAESNLFKGIEKYKKGQITGVERLQQLIDVWNQTSEFLKQEVIRNFETTDLFNPVYMMAFSGARGNISQVRQLVGMRGLMSDPQGNIIDFPIQSNFREGLTLTEYIISTYGARKGIVDTALRTATAGYLTRRLVDVAQHVMISQFDCGTTRGIFLFDMKEGGKTIYSFQNRLIGRVLANDIDSSKSLHSPRSFASPLLHSSAKRRSEGIGGADAFALPSAHGAKASAESMPSLASAEASLKQAKGRKSKGAANKLLHGKSNNKESYILKAYRNQEISSSLAASIAKITKKAFVRSPLTCETHKLVCQLCYGWSLASSKLVSLGEAVGVIAAQSIGEPGTQLTMRTFHTGGVFSGGLTNQIIAPYDGYVEYSDPIPGTCIRTPQGDISFLTKAQGSFFIKENQFLLEENGNKLFRSEFYTIPAYAILFARNKQQIFKKQIVAQFSSIGQQQTQRGNAEQTVYAELEGEISFSQIDLLEQQNEKLFEDIVLKAIDWSKIWILSGKMYYDPLGLNSFGINGDFFNRNTTFQKIYWHNLNSCFLDIPLKKQKNFIFKGIKRFSLTKNKDFFYKKRIINSTFNCFFKKQTHKLIDSFESSFHKDWQKTPNKKYKKFEQKQNILNINIDNFNLNREKAIFFNKIPKNFYIKGFKNKLVLFLNQKFLYYFYINFKKHNIVSLAAASHTHRLLPFAFDLPRSGEAEASASASAPPKPMPKQAEGRAKQQKKNKKKIKKTTKKLSYLFLMNNPFDIIKFLNKKTSLNNKVQQNFEIFSKSKIVFSKFYNNKNARFYKINDSLELKKIKQKMNLLYEKMIKNYYLKNLKNIKFNFINSYNNNKNHKNDLKLVGVNKIHNIKEIEHDFQQKAIFSIYEKNKQKNKKIAKKICLYNKKQKTTNMVPFKALLKNKTNSVYYYPFRTFIRFFLFKKINRIHFLSYYMKKALKSSVTKKKKKLKYLISDVNTTKQTNIKKLMNPFILKNSIPNFLKKKTIKKRIFSTIPELEDSLYEIYNFKKVKKTDIKNYSVLLTDPGAQANQYFGPLDQSILSSAFSQPIRGSEPANSADAMCKTIFNVRKAMRCFSASAPPKQKSDTEKGAKHQSFILKLKKKKQNSFDIKVHSYNKIPKVQQFFHPDLSDQYLHQLKIDDSKKLLLQQSKIPNAKNINNRIINGFYKRKPILTLPVNKISFKKFGYIFSINQSYTYSLKSKIKSDLILSYFPLTNSYNTPISSSNINDPGKNFQKLSLGNTLNFSPFSNIAFRWFPLNCQTISNGIYIWSRNFLINERTIEKNIKIYNKVYKENPDFYISNYYFFQKKRWIYLNGLFKKYNKKEILNFNTYMNKLSQNIKNKNFIYINNYSFSQSKIGTSTDLFESIENTKQILQTKNKNKLISCFFSKNNKKNEIMCFNEKKLNNQLQIYEKYRKKSYNLKFRYDLSLNQRLRIFVTKKYVKKLFYFNQSTFKEIEDVLKIKTPFFNSITKFSKFSVYKQDFYYIPQENSRFHIFNSPFFFGSQLCFKYYLSNRQGFKKLLPSEVSGLTRIYTQNKNLKTKLTNKNFGKIQVAPSLRIGSAEAFALPRSGEAKASTEPKPKRAKGRVSERAEKRCYTKKEKEFLISCLYNNNLKNNVLIPKKFNKKTIYPQNKKKHKNFISSIKIKKASYNMDLNIRHKMSSNILKKFLKKQKNKKFQKNSNLKNIKCSNLYKYYDFNKNLSNKRIEEKPFIAQLKNQSFFFSCIPFISYQQSKIDSKQKQALKIKNKAFISTSQVERIKKPGWVYFLIDSYNKNFINTSNKNFINTSQPTPLSSQSKRDFSVLKNNFLKSNEKLKIKNFFSFKTLHQTFINEGKKVIHDICFEQNKIYIENVTLSPHSSLYSLSFILSQSESDFLSVINSHSKETKERRSKGAKEFALHSLLHEQRLRQSERRSGGIGIGSAEAEAFASPLRGRAKERSVYEGIEDSLCFGINATSPEQSKTKLKNKKINISKLYTNKNCRFFNGFVSTMLFNKKNENISIHEINENNLALLFRPIQHKILPNPQLFKKQISNNQKNSYNNYSILFYKDYHSNLLNLQNCPKKSLSKFPSVDFQIRQVSQNINLYSLNHSRYRKIKERSYNRKDTNNKKKLKNNMKNGKSFITLYNNKPVKLKKQSILVDKKVRFYMKKYSMYNKPYYFSNIYYSAYKIHSFSLELKNTKPLGLDFGFNIPTIILKPSYSNVIKQQNLNFLKRNYSKNLKQNNLSQIFYYLMKKNMLRKLWISKTFQNFSVDTYKNWFNKNRVSSINLKADLNSFFAFFYLYPFPFIEWSLTKKDDYLANNLLSSDKKIQNTKNCLFPNKSSKIFNAAPFTSLASASAEPMPMRSEQKNIKFQNLKNAILNYKQSGIINKYEMNMQPFTIAFPLIKNSFLLYKAYNKILANQVYATTNLLSPFEGELLTQNNNNKWWNQSAETGLTHKKLNIKHYIFLTKKDMFSISLDLNSSQLPRSFDEASRSKTKQKEDKNFDINEYLSLFSTLYSNYKNLFNKNIKQQTQTKLFDKLKSSTLNTLNVHLNTYFSTHNKKKYNILNFVTKYQNKIYKLKGLSIGKVSENKVLNLHLGKFLLKGDNIFFDQKIDQTGQIIHLSSKKITLRYAQPFLISPKGILHVQQGDYVYRNAPIITLPFETLMTGDIVQGIPKVEQYLEARTTQNGRFFLYSLPVLQKAIFERYRAKLPLEQAVAQSFLKIQQIIVDGVQRVYRSQGVSIAEKHLEVIVKQMTSKVQIIHGGQTGFFPGELVDLEIVESVNKFLMVKIRYEPIVLGITRASLEVESFLSAASFQQTTKILAKASLSKKKDYLKGLKENLLVGNLIPAGTGFMNSY